MSRPATAFDNRITVAVADDHPVYLAALERAVRDDPRLHLVGSARNGHEALELTRVPGLDVAVIDYRIGEPDGIEILERRHTQPPRPKVLLISADDTPQVIHRALSAGAAGYLTKDDTAQDIIAAVIRVAQGERVLSRASTAALIALHDRSQPKASGRLSARESKVIELLADGLTRDEISDRLDLSPSTTKEYLDRAYAKLGVSNGAAAVAQAFRNGSIS